VASISRLSLRTRWLAADRERIAIGANAADAITYLVKACKRVRPRHRLRTLLAP